MRGQDIVPDDRPNLAVVIPSLNAANLQPCIDAICHNEMSRPVVCVVDDGVDWGRVYSDAVIVHRLEGVKPFVFARNVNLGLRWVFTGDKCFDGAIVLNDDAILKSSDGFTGMARAAAEREQIGVVGATCNNVGNPNQFPKGIGLRGEDRMVCFVCVYIPRRTWELVGPLDERYVGYGMDDDDYCLRVRNAGLQIAVHDGCYVDHGSLTSSYRGAGGAGGDFRGNLELFKQKWGFDNWGRPA